LFRKNFRILYNKIIPIISTVVARDAGDTAAFPGKMFLGKSD